MLHAAKKPHFVGLKSKDNQGVIVNAPVFNRLSRYREKSIDISRLKTLDHMAFLLLEDMDIHMARQGRARPNPFHHMSRGY